MKTHTKTEKTKMKKKILTFTRDVLKYIERLGIALSVLLNVILGGYSNQSFSARNWQRKRDGLWHLCDLIDVIFWFEKDHCLTSWTYWRVRKDVLHTQEFDEKFKILENGKYYD